MGWTDERVELLKKLWQDGLSASQIAKQLGGVTRNAVIGKVHRLGLSGRATPSAAATASASSADWMDLAAGSWAKTRTVERMRNEIRAFSILGTMGVGRRWEGRGFIGGRGRIGLPW